MVVLGADLHKRSHTMVATDGTGRKLAEKTVAATDAGHRELRRWAGQWPGRAGLAANPARATRSMRWRWPAPPCASRTCRSPRWPVPSAISVCSWIIVRISSANGPGPRTACAGCWSSWTIAEPPAGALARAKVLASLDADLAGRPETTTRIARAQVAQVRSLTIAAQALEAEIDDLAGRLAPSLRALRGCDPLTTAKLVGETAGIGRFRSAAAFAMHNGTAPVPVWSGNVVRHRLNRGGNRQLNAALHRIAITHLQRPGPSADYVAKRKAAGDTRTEAIRALRRRISDEVFRRLRDDEAARSSHLASAA